MTHDGVTCVVNLRRKSGTCDFYRKMRPRTACRHFWAVAYQIDPPEASEFEPPLAFEPMPPQTPAPAPTAKPEVRDLLAGGFSTTERRAYEKALQSEFPGVLKLAEDIFAQYAGDRLWKEKNEWGTGRHAFPLRLMLLSNLIRFYNRYSLRRTAGLLELLRRVGYIEVVPKFGALGHFIASPAVTSMLEDLIYVTALPFQKLGRFRLAADGTGFSSSHYGDYRLEHRHHDNRRGDAEQSSRADSEETNVALKKEKQRKEVREQQWWRVVAVSEVDALAVLAVNVSSESVGEQTAFKRMLPGLVARGWDVHSFRLDAGFDDTLLRDSMAEAGYDPMIPYRDGRVNAIPVRHVGKVRNPEALERMFHLFALQDAELKREYGSRAKAECLFSSIERVFGKYVDSRGEIAARNEILTIFLCHNLRMLHIGQALLDSKNSDLRLIAS